MLKGGFLRLLQTILYILTFAFSAVILGSYAFFLAELAANANGFITDAQRAVVGISGIAVVFTLFGIILTCCLGGVTFFGYVAVVLNVAFVAAMIAVAVLLRGGNTSCDLPNVWLAAPVGHQINYANFFGGSLSRARFACRLNKASFASSIAAVLLFAILAVVQLVLVRRGKTDKRYGPGPDNGYTSGQHTRRMPWHRNKETVPVEPAYATRDAEMGRADMRPSHDTAYTGSTVAAPGQQTGYVKDAEPVRY